MEHLLLSLKLKLQNLGALRPEAWERIESLITTIELKPQQHLIRQESYLCYVASGLLKECDLSQRVTPSIINFFGNGDYLHCFADTHRLYLEAILPTTLFSLNLRDLQTLYLEFKELASIYGKLCFEYQERLLLRMHLLEIYPRNRIIFFRRTHQCFLPYLQKKDMCNYLHLDYDYFVRNYRKLL